MRRYSSHVKITCPVVSGVLLRKRLFGRLSEARKKLAIWISAPGGSGKTTLVASYLESARTPCIWYQVDREDGDPATFFHYLGLAVKKAVPKNRQPLPLFTSEYLPRVQAFARRYFERLYGMLGAKAPFSIVLDNYQEVPEDLDFQEIVETGLSLAPEGVNFIVLSRHGLPARFSRLYANGRIEMLGWKDMQFTLAETKELFSPKGKPPATHFFIESLHRETEGWIAGMILLNENANREGRAGRPDPAWKSEDLFNYFAVEVFGKNNEETRKFLLKTAFLPQIEPLTAERLTGMPHAGRLLSRLSREHFFTTKHPDESAVFQYHPLFREFLNSKAAEVFGPEELWEIKTKAAGLLSGAKRVEDAVALYFQAGAFEQIGRLILENARDLIRQGRAETVKRWVEYLPALQVEGNPELMYWKGVSLSPIRPLEGRDHLKKAFHIFRARNERAWMFLSWSEIVAISFHCTEYSGIEAWLGIIREILDQDPAFPSAEIEARVMINIFNSLAIKASEGFDIDAFCSRAFSLLFSGEQMDIELRIMTGNYLCVYFLWKGDLVRAGIIVNFFDNLLTKENIPDLFLMSVMAVKALYEFFTGNCSACIETVRKALGLSGRCGVHIWDDHLRGNAAAAALSGGAAGAAGKMLAGMCGDIDKTRKLDRAFYYFLESWRSMLSDDIEGAYRYQELCGELVPEAGYWPPVAAMHMARAEILYFKGDRAGAESAFAMGKEIARLMGSAYLEFMYSCIKANIALHAGDESEASALLKKALSTAREHALTNMYWWRPAAMARLCEKAIHDGMETEFAKELIRRRDLFPESPPETDLWPYAIKIYTLNGFEVLVNDRPLESGGKIQKKPLGMLKMLAAAGPEPASDAEIIDSLWPEAEGDLARKSFDTTLYRLRKLLKNEKAVFLRDGKIGLNRRYVWADIWSFGALCLKAEREPSVRAPLLEEALMIYKGKFLPADGDPWAASKREKLGSLFAGLVMRLGSDYERAGELEKAAAIYRRGIETDDTVAEFYRNLMLCLSRLGQAAEAKMVYNQCRLKLGPEKAAGPF